MPVCPRRHCPGGGTCPPAAQSGHSRASIHTTTTTTMLDIIFSSRLLATVHAMRKRGRSLLKDCMIYDPLGLSNVRPAAWIRPVSGVFAARKMIFAKYKNGLQFFNERNCCSKRVHRMSQYCCCSTGKLLIPLPSYVVFLPTLFRLLLAALIAPKKSVL